MASFTCSPQHPYTELSQPQCSSIVLHQLEESSLCSLEARPSKICKSPYVADGLVDTCKETETRALIHTPSLGCCGLVEKGSCVVVSPIQITKKSQSESDKPKCTFRADLAIIKEEGKDFVVGVNPKLAESIVEQALVNGLIRNVTLKDPGSYGREKTLLHSRFDFVGTDANGREFVLEVKNVPLADYVDVPKKEKKKAMAALTPNDKDTMKKIAYFPDGYRKSGQQIVSPRALKHIQELEEIVTTTNKRAILCFVIQRPDANRFLPSLIDPTYREAVQKAWCSGVEINTLQVTWNTRGVCTYLRNDLPVHLFDTEGPQTNVE